MTWVVLRHYFWGTGKHTLQRSILRKDFQSISRSIYLYTRYQRLYLIYWIETCWMTNRFEQFFICRPFSQGLHTFCEKSSKGHTTQIGVQRIPHLKAYYRYILFASYILYIRLHEPLYIYIYNMFCNIMSSSRYFLWRLLISGPTDILKLGRSY